MPIQRKTLCQSFKCMELHTLKKYRLALASINLNTAVMSAMILAFCTLMKGNQKKMCQFLYPAALIAGLVEVNAQLASLQLQ